MMRTISLDGAEMTDRETTHRQLMEKLSLPAYYGHNLDALHDCLTDIAEPTHILLSHAGTMLSCLRMYGVRLLRVFFDAAEDNAHLCFDVLRDEKD